MKTAVIYARYSCDAQTEQSIEGQLHVCKEYAEKNDLLVVDEYIDRATTGTNDNRAAFQQMLADSKRGFGLGDGEHPRHARGKTLSGGHRGIQ